MELEALELEGLYAIRYEPLVDERGFFARTFCADEFRAWGLDPRVAQASISHNARARTLRGLHYQAAPHEECKVVRCTRGSVWDVVVDVRPSSPTYLRWSGRTLSEDGDTMLYIPPGFAHGFLTQVPDSQLHYQMSVPHAPASSRGIRWDDPAVGIAWPEEPDVVSERDRSYADLVP